MKLARGERRPSRINYDEPQLEVTLPAPPHWLRGDALKRWHVVAPQLAEAGVLTELDVGALAAYCRYWARLKKAEDKIEEFGMVIQTRNGNPVQSPYVGIANRAALLVARYEEQFGMTPSSRTRVKVDVRRKRNSTLERFFGIGGGRG